MRLQLFEFEDLSWFPSVIRESMTDYLRYCLNTSNFYKPTTSFLAECLISSGENKCIDLCAGGGGAVESVIKNLKEENNFEVQFILTDKFPNIEAFEFIRKTRPSVIDYIATPVDATNVPTNLTGVRTMYSALHHFTPATIRSILQNVTESKAAVAIFDGGDKSILTIFGMLLLHPIVFFLFTPFFRPFKISRIIFTYLIPIIPLCTIWDGFVSVLRLYKATELLTIAKDAEPGYNWKAGYVKNRFGIKLCYLTGIPDQKPGNIYVADSMNVNA